MRRRCRRNAHARPTDIRLCRLVCPRSNSLRTLTQPNGNLDIQPAELNSIRDAFVSLLSLNYIITKPFEAESHYVEYYDLSWHLDGSPEFTCCPTRQPVLV
jgi:hypothetical protein